MGIISAVSLQAKSFFPLAACLLFAFLVQSHSHHLSIQVLDSLSLLPFVSCGLALITSLCTNRVRDLSLSLLLVFSYWVIYHFLQMPLHTEPAGQLFWLLSHLLPIAMGTIILLPDIGWRSLAPIIYFCSLTLICILIYCLFQWQENWLNHLLHHDVLQGNKDGNGWQLKLNVAASLLFLLALVTTILKPVANGETIETVLPGCLLLVFVTLGWFQKPYISAVMFSTCGMLLILHQIQQLSNLVYRDDLTQIPNRRALMRDSDNLGSHYNVAMVDVDHFKSINDNYGHDTGDQVLKAIASCLARVSSNGKCYRFGGEEFCLIFTNKDSRVVLESLEKLRKQIANYDISSRDKKHRPWLQLSGKRKRGATKRKGDIQVTVSMGVASSLDYLSFEEVIKAADNAMYQAKSSGRNRIISA